MTRRLLVLGAGYLGSEVAKQRGARGVAIVATTRDEARARVLGALGAVVIAQRPLVGEAVAEHVDASTDVLVTFPPDPPTDDALARACAGARAVVYVSSTAVYERAGREVDDRTPPAAASPRALARLAAERAWQERAGARIVRAPAIYGAGRGLHLRMAEGTVRRWPGARGLVSRVHVADLAVLAGHALDAAPAGDVLLAGDLAPAPHDEVLDFLAEELGLPPPELGAEADTPDTLRGDRLVVPSVSTRGLSADPALALAFPSYREGYRAAIAADAELLAARLGR